MIYWNLIRTLFLIFLVSFFGTIVLEHVFRYLGTRGYLGNLFPNVRGGIPRGMGILPFILLSFLILPKFNDLILIIGIAALIDDILGRKSIPILNVEWGQVSRLIGLILVIIVGLYQGLGVSAILIGLLIQPINVSDMQPGSTCMVTMIMSSITILIILALAIPWYMELPAFYTPLIILLIVLAYSPLDFAGRIMLGEVGNHSLAIALGIAFYLVGGFLPVLILSILTVCLTVFVRRNTLEEFLMNKLNIYNPTVGDCFMDVLTGGSLGDLFRKIFLGKQQRTVKDPILISLGFRRLFYNPYAPNNFRYESNYKF